MQVQVVTGIALVLFFASMVIIGLYSRRHAKTMDGFLLGGRNIGAWMSAFAYGTSYFSAVIFIGYAGKHGWDIGFASMWIGIGNAVIGCFLAWKILAKRTRSMTYSLGVKTMPEFFEARYSSTAMKLFSAVVIFIFLVPYSAAVYKGLGSMFNTIFPNVSLEVCTLAIAVITGIFLVMGGYVATVYTDFVQGIIMIAGVILMVVIFIAHPNVGGLSAGISKIKELGATEGKELTSIFGGSNFKFLCTNILLTSFGTWGLPQMVTKFYAVKDDSAVKKATIVSTGFALIIGVGAYFIGSLGRLFLNNTLPAEGHDFIIPRVLMTALGDSNLFTTIVLAVILLLLLSASMSTLSAIVLTSSSAISVDLLPVVTKKEKPKHQMLITKVLCLLFVALSFIFASFKIAVIVSIMSFSWGVVSGTFIGPYIWGLYSKKVSKNAAWIGMLSGFLTILILTLIKTISVSFSAATNDAPVYGVIAMAVSFIVTPVSSLFIKQDVSKKVEEAFSKLKAEAK